MWEKVSKRRRLYFVGVIQGLCHGLGLPGFSSVGLRVKNPPPTSSPTFSFLLNLSKVGGWVGRHGRDALGLGSAGMTLTAQHQGVENNNSKNTHTHTKKKELISIVAMSLNVKGKSAHPLACLGLADPKLHPRG